MWKIFQNETGSAKIGTFNNIEYFYNIWVIKLFKKVILSFYFGWFDRE